MKPAVRIPMLPQVCLAVALALGACGGGDAEPDASPPHPDGPLPSGTFSLSWTIDDGAGTATCDQVGGANVTLTFIPNDGSVGFVEAFSCELGSGTTSMHTAKTGSIDIALKSASGQVLGTLPRITSKELVAGTDTPLDAVVFTVSRLGKLAFKIDVPGAAGLNCAAENTGGANLTGVRVELRTLAGDCVATAYEVAAGTGTGAQSIPSGCPAPVVACIEGDQQVTASDVPAGTYKLVLEGFEGGVTDTACYKSESQVAIAGGGVVNDLMVVGLPVDGTNAACMLP